MFLLLTGKNATEQEIGDFIAECEIMVDFDHPNVMRLVGVCFDTDNGLPLIVLPYMANGDLRSFLQSKRLNDNLTEDSEQTFPAVRKNIYIMNNI